MYSSVTSWPGQSEAGASLIFQKELFEFHSSFEELIEVDIPLKVRSNGTMYTHLFLTSQKADLKVVRLYRVY